MTTPITPGQAAMLQSFYQSGAKHLIKPVAEPRTTGPKEGFDVFLDPTGFNVCLLPCTDSEIQFTALFMRHVWNLWPEIQAALALKNSAGSNGEKPREA